MESAPSYNQSILPADTQAAAPAVAQQQVQRPMDMQAAQQQNKEAGIFPMFSTRPQQNMLKSEEAGHPVYEEYDWVKIVVAGDRNNIIERKMSDADKERWAIQYTAYKSGKGVAMEGTPLEQWPQIPRTMVETLKHFNIFSVEALAQLSDSGIQAIGMGARDLANKALAYLTFAKDTALPQKQAAEIQRQSDLIQSMQQQIEEIGNAALQGRNLQAQIDEVAPKLENTELLLSTETMKLKNANAELEQARAENAELKQNNATLKGKITKLENAAKKPE